MPYSLSVWLDDKTASILEQLAHHEERKRGAMIKVLIHRAYQKLCEAEDHFIDQKPNTQSQNDQDI